MEKPALAERRAPAGIEGWAANFADRRTEELLAWALDRFHPRIALACSFGAEDMVLLDMLAHIMPGARVFYLDTGLLFEETYRLRDLVSQAYDIELIRVTPQWSVEEQAEHLGPALWSRQPDLCCRLRKVEPLQRMLAQLDAWITGIRREQTPARAHAEVVEWDGKFQLVKINPLARWNQRQVWDYIREHKVPYNPLHDRGYPSIGCQPCTQPVQPGEDPRAGRWPGFGKTECGLHG